MPSPAPKMVKFQGIKNEVFGKGRVKCCSLRKAFSQMAPPKFTTDGVLGKEKTESQKAV